ncbi:MFS transporter [Salinibacterium sp. SYSU T00001]|uniref:MDR family MFS transporter n=1 Tax=Homoserinimonas sedimenticola TaxID=2986805 RepID=UPI00223636DD|nr:MDR family MFS transporter [Salinibacterium sedimenticola]MCW4385912.1 MFS transporter [Salinibacterium sedimenticola]
MSLSPLRLRLLVAALLTVSFLGALDHTIVSTSLATIAGELGALEHMSWIVVGYTLAATVMLPILGKLADLMGPKRVFLACVLVFTLASLACGFAQEMSVLVAARVVQGVSSAGLQLLSQTILAHVTSPRQRPRYMAIIGAAFPIAILVGPVIGGAITDYWGWQWIFWLNVPLGLAAVALAAAAVPTLEGGIRSRFDYAGSITFTVALLALVLGVTWATEGETVALAVAAFALAAVAGVAFVVIDLRVADPLVPLRMFGNRTIAAGLALSAIIGVGLFSVTAYLPTYVQMTYRTSATVSGLIPIATVFGMLVSNLLTGWLASRTGRYRLFPILGTTMGMCGFVVMAALPVGMPLWVPMVVMAVVGLGTGAFMSLVFAVVQSAVERRHVGSVTATINLVRQVGSTVATAIIGVVVATGVSGRLPGFLDHSGLTPQLVHEQSGAVQAEIADIYGSVFSPVFAALAATYLVGLVAAILLPGGTLSDDAQHEPAASDAPAGAPATDLATKELESP